MQIIQKPKNIFFDGIPVHIPNEVRQNNQRFYVSYNSNSHDYGCSTTALVLNDPQMTKFYILCGDHRKQYEAAVTLEACLAYYAAHAALQHKFSDKL